MRFDWTVPCTHGAHAIRAMYAYMSRHARRHAAEAHTGGAAVLRYEALVRGFWPARYHACAIIICIIVLI